MALFGGCNCFDGDDTILWFIILFLLIFCNNFGDVRGSNC
ncbi:MAG: hypothetical protein BWY15_00647 [Firmicutes bacterium ADurb.Bin193]|nr:MAG: hypothetical protein BWY15_00647 [Firmicutes bacterium ADurb.Bin193]